LLLRREEALLRKLVHLSVQDDVSVILCETGVRVGFVSGLVSSLSIMVRSCMKSFRWSWKLVGGAMAVRAVQHTNRLCGGGEFRAAAPDELVCL
jgi:hypothetical protein